MKTFKVKIKRTDYFTVEVRNEFETEAELAALEIICNEANPIASDHFDYCDGFSPVSVEVAS